MTRTIGTKIACAAAVISLTAIGSPAFANGSVPPSDLTWAPIAPTPGGDLVVSFKGCNAGESVLVSVWATSAGWHFDSMVTAKAPDEINTQSVTLNHPSIAAGQEFGVAIYCGGVWTDVEGRWVRAYGTTGEAEETTTTTSTTTAPSSTTSTTATASPSTTLQPTVGSNNAARTAAAVSGVPNFTG